MNNGLKLKQALPDAHVTVGGPAITQLLIRLRGPDLARALGPFDSAVVFEGEHTLLRLWEALDAGPDTEPADGATAGETEAVADTDAETEASDAEAAESDTETIAWSTDEDARG